ncbi:MAG: molybdopterin molybdotransferase MoeA [Holophagaceae bacterium]|nr:molybdopterin molybdotransferase MoeA [Holophagaceae bacterium]
MTLWREALEIILSQVEPRRRAVVGLDSALSMVAAETIVSPEKLPPFDNSAMDGFAVRAVDCENASLDSPVSLRILEDLPAGCAPNHSLTPRTATRIMTGAPMPIGSSAVVPVEDTRSGKETVDILKAIKPKKNVRFAGEDIDIGMSILRVGQVIKPSHIGLLAALGISEIPIFPQVRVAIITTGSELVDHTEKPGVGQIRDANLHSLSAQVRSWGAIPMPFPRICDTRESVELAVNDALETCDLLLTTGGVSVGDYDFVKGTLDSVGAKLHFWKVDQKPGGPFGFWTLGEKPFFGIPGNPVSAMVMAELYLRPAIYKMMGRQNFQPQPIRANLESGFCKSSNDSKRHFLRVVAEERQGRWVARLSGPQGSAQLSSICVANALAMVPEDAIEIPAGGEVEIILIKNSLSIDDSNTV